MPGLWHSEQEIGGLPELEHEVPGPDIDGGASESVSMVSHTGTRDTVTVPVGLTATVAAAADTCKRHAGSGP